MNLKHLLFFATSFLLASCSDSYDEPVIAEASSATSLQNEVRSRSLENEDSVPEEEYELLKFTDQLRNLKETYEMLHSANPQLMAYYSPDDEYFSSNMAAIEGMNLFIRVRKAGDTSSSNRVYMSSDGAGISL